MAQLLVQLQLPDKVKVFMNPVVISLGKQSSASAALALVESALQQSTGVPGIFSVHNLLFTDKDYTRYIQPDSALAKLLANPEDPGQELLDCMIADDGADADKLPSFKLYLNLGLPQLQTHWLKQSKVLNGLKRKHGADKDHTYAGLEESETNTVGYSNTSSSSSSTRTRCQAHIGSGSHHVPMLSLLPVYMLCGMHVCGMRCMHGLQYAAVGYLFGLEAGASRLVDHYPAY